MDKQAVRSIIETTLKKGSRSPGVFDIPKATSLKIKLERCNSVEEVVTILLNNVSSIVNMFGIKTVDIDKGISDIRALS